MRSFTFLPVLALPVAMAENMAAHVMNGLGASVLSSQWQTSTSIVTLTATTTSTLTTTTISTLTLSVTSPSLMNATISPTFVPAAASETAVVIPLRHELIDQPLGRFGETAHLGGVDVDFGVDIVIPISCLNCSTFGQIEVTAGDFDSGDLGFSNAHCIATANGLGGYFEFSLASVTLSHTFALLKVPTPLGFVVPGVGVAGVTFELDLNIGLEFLAFTNLTFGFEYYVPNGSYIDVDISNVENSTSHGFLPSQGLEIIALPVGSDGHGLDFAISATLTPKLQVGIEFWDNSTSATAAVLLEIPALRLEERQLSNVDNQCRPIVNNSSSVSEVAFVGDATSIVPSAGFDLRVNAGFGLGDFSWSDGITLASTTVTFPGTCIQNGQTAIQSPTSSQGGVATGIATRAHTASLSSPSGRVATANGWTPTVVCPTASGSTYAALATSNATAFGAPYSVTAVSSNIAPATEYLVTPTPRNVTAP